MWEHTRSQRVTARQLSPAITNYCQRPLPSMIRPEFPLDIVSSSGEPQLVNVFIAVDRCTSNVPSPAINVDDRPQNYSENLEKITQFETWANFTEHLAC